MLKNDSKDDRDHDNLDFDDLDLDSLNLDEQDEQGSDDHASSDSGSEYAKCGSRRSFWPKRRQRTESTENESETLHLTT